MSVAAIMPADPAVGGHPTGGWRLVAALAVTQTVGYDTLYYAYAVLLQLITVAGCCAVAAAGMLTGRRAP